MIDGARPAEIIREASKRGDDVDRHREGIASRQEHLRRIAVEKGLRPKPWRTSEKQLAETHGRDGYLDFRYGHHLVHGSSFALVLRKARLDDEHESTVIGQPGPERDQLGPLVELTAGEFMLEACRALAVILDLEKPEGLDELLSGLQAAGARLSATPAS